MKNKKILGLPMIYGICVVGVILIGIIIGSIWDFNINVALANKTKIGNIFASYGMIFAYCLYPTAGMCIFKGLKAKNNEKYSGIAWVFLIISYFLAVYYSNSYMGSKLRDLLGYSNASSKFWISVLSWVLWVIFYSWVPVLFYFILDEVNPGLLIATGVTILVAGLVSDCLNVWLKQVASRPRYKYLLTLEDQKSEYRNWWQMIPNLAGSNDSFKSWPSGNMAISSMMFSLPLLTRLFKKHHDYFEIIAFAFAALYVVLFGYNRIHMTNHFLSDVCFGTLFTYLVFACLSHYLDKTFN